MVVDVVDSNNVTISTARRGDLFTAKSNFRTVHIILHDDKNRIILQKLRPDHDRSPGRLGSSVAGYVATGETYEQAAYRKLQIELGAYLLLDPAGDFMMVDHGCRKFVGVFTGLSTAALRFDPNEIQSLLYMPATRLAGEMKTNPSGFTSTFQELYLNKRGIFNI